MGNPSDLVVMRRSESETTRGPNLEVQALLIRRKKPEMGKRNAQVNACVVDPVATLHFHTRLDDTTINKAESSTTALSVLGTAAVDTMNEPSESVDLLDKPVNLFIEADEFHVRSYVDVNIEHLPKQKALINGGSEICCINSELIRDLNVLVCKQVNVSGLRGKSNAVHVVRLNVKPASNECCSMVNIGLSTRVWFAVVPQLNESVILIPNIVSLLQDVVRYNVLSISVNLVNDIADSDVNCAEKIVCQSNVSQKGAVNDSRNDVSGQFDVAYTSDSCDQDKDQLSDSSETPPDFIDIDKV
jgi:hypothetical protein